MVFSGVFFIGCKKWDDHNALTDPSVGQNLFEQISANPDLSKFAELLTKSGYDKIISSSKTYTVFAPTNAALATIDPAVVADEVKLRMFVGNHIANQLYQTVTTPAQVRLIMINGKYNNLQGKTFDEANITTADKFAKNGFLNVIDKMVPALPNAWEFVETSSIAPAKQKAHLLTLFRNVFDLTNAVQTGVNPATGQPVYKPGTDSIRINQFWRDVLDLRDESKQFTFFMLTDAAWDGEVNKFKPFFASGSVDSTTVNTSNAVVRDLAIEGIYKPGAGATDTIVSKFNIKVGIEKSAIVQTIKVSNGIIYVMSRMNVLTKHKFLPFTIQGENYDFTRQDKRGNTYFRDRFNPLTQQDFKDVVVVNHGVAQFYLGYRINNMPTMKFKAYWVAVHDNINLFTGTFKQKFSVGDPLNADLPYTTVTANDYREIYLGEFILTKFNPVTNVYLTADNSGSVNVNTLSLDYVRLEPVFN